MLGFVFQLSATGVAQSVKIEKQLQSLETVFEQVESQTGLLIMFSNNELDVNRKVSLDVRKYTLEELLRKVLEGTNMDFDLEQNYVVIRPARSVAVRDSVVKTNKIKGVVVDAHGEPLPGVTVVAKRGEILVTGAASDGSGKFEIVVPADIRELSFTFVGYKTAVVPVELNKEMTIRMEEEVSEVDEVVVTGYFTKSKSSYTGAVKSVTAEQLKNRAVLLRTMLLHDYGRLAVTTIDRFFQRIIKAFTRELGIFPGYNVELDSDFVLLKAVDKVMQQVKDNPGLKNWISELMSSNVEEGKSWSIKSKIAELGEELFKENYMLFDKHILDKFSDKEFLKNYRSFLTATVQAYESRQAAIGQEAIGLIRSEGLEQTDFKGGKAGCVSYFYKLVAGLQ